MLKADSKKPKSIKLNFIMNKNQNLFLRLLIIYGKFLILMIPKIITFFIIFFCFYYKIEDFIYLFNSKQLIII